MKDSQIYHKTVSSRSAFIVFALSALFLAGCPHHRHPQVSPGQVQRATGYNPASGKMHPHGGPPGQDKKKYGHH